MATAYITENLVAGGIVSATKTAATGTYKRGQLLGRVDSTSVYGAYNGADNTGLENVRAICAMDTVLSAPGKIATYITGSTVNARGIVDSAGDAVTVTATIIESAQDSGIVIK